jgi:DNA-directed RNA polymerase subunit RPC12/RpoP
MSDHSVYVVRLDPPAGEVDALAASVRAWMVEEGVVTEDGSPGDRWRSVLNDVETDPSVSAFAAVSVETEWQVFTAMGNLTPPTCARCGAQRPEDIDYVEEWWVTRVEPEITCPSCGWTALDGDWPGPFWLAASDLAVRFWDWPLLSEQFLAAVRARLGGRTRVIYEHI